jgi:hypothetical protein
MTINYIASINKLNIQLWQLNKYIATINKLNIQLWQLNKYIATINKLNKQLWQLNKYIATINKLNIQIWSEGSLHSSQTMDINSQHHNLLGNQIMPKSEDFCILAAIFYSKWSP